MKFFNECAVATFIIGDKLTKLSNMCTVNPCDKFNALLIWFSWEMHKEKRKATQVPTACILSTKPRIQCYMLCRYVKNEGKFKNTFQVIIDRENKAYHFEDKVCLSEAK